MLHKCANSACMNLFRSLHHGKLFQVATEPALPKRFGARRPITRVEHYWLCEECSLNFTLTYGEARGLVAVPLVCTEKLRNPDAANHSKPVLRAELPLKGSQWRAS